MQSLSYKSVGVRAAVALITVSSASLASAVTIHQDFNIPSATTQWSQFPSLNKFNTALGTLNSVTLYLSNTTQTEIWLANLSESSGNTIKGQVDSTITIRDQADTTNLLSAGVSLSQQGDYDTNTHGGVATYSNNEGNKFGAISDTESNSTTYNTVSGMARFVGSGLINFRVRASALSTTSDTAGNAKADYITTAAAAGYLEYDYTPAAVPEPTSMAALGLGALALLRRRNRKA